MPRAILGCRPSDDPVFGGGATLKYDVESLTSSPSIRAMAHTFDWVLGARSPAGNFVPLLPWIASYGVSNRIDTRNRVL
jgi:hypothetical protein